MAVAVAVAVSGGVAVPVAVPVALPVAGLTKRFFNHIQKDFLINVWSYPERSLFERPLQKIKDIGLEISISKLPKMHSDASGGAPVLAARITLLLARSCLLRADLKFFGSPEGTSNALFRSTWPFFRSN